MQTAAYVVMAEPPSEAGGVKAMLAWPLPGVAAPMVGAPGGPAGVTFAVAEATELPRALVATTLHAYVVPFVRLLTVIGLVVAVAVAVVWPDALQDAV